MTQPAEKPTLTEFVLGLAAELEAKNVAYGNAFAKSVEHLTTLYPTGVTVEQYADLLAEISMFNKAMRVANQPDAFGEDPRKDRAGYALLAAYVAAFGEPPASTDAYATYEANVQRASDGVAALVRGHDVGSSPIMKHPLATSPGRSLVPDSKPAAEAPLELDADAFLGCGDKFDDQRCCLRQNHPGDHQSRHAKWPNEGAPAERPCRRPAGPYGCVFLEGHEGQCHGKKRPDGPGRGR